MSVSPRQNFLKPPPVPEMPTVTLTAPFFVFWNSSATPSVIDGSYNPLSRPIFIYVSDAAYRRAEVREFVEYYLKEGANFAREVKYVPLPAAAYTGNLDHVAKKKLGTVFGGKNEVGFTIEELMKREAKM